MLSCMLILIQCLRRHIILLIKYLLKLPEMLTPGPVSKHFRGFSYLRSEDYELDMNFDVKELKIKSDHTSNDIVKCFCKKIFVLEEEWVFYLNLTGVGTFPKTLI